MDPLAWDGSPGEPGANAIFFGSLDLAPLEIEDVDAPLPEDHDGEALRRLSLRDSPAADATTGKRGRAENETPGPASNKMANMEPGGPVPLPAYGQNVFVGRDLTVTRQARADEQALRVRVEECVAPAGRATAEQRTRELKEEIAERKRQARGMLAEDVWKPGTLAVLSQLVVLLDELEAMLEVSEAERAGKGAAECVRLLIMDQELCCPLMLKDETGPLTLKVVSSPALVLSCLPKDLSASAVSEEGNPAELKAKAAGRPVVLTKGLRFTHPSIAFEKGSRNRVVRLVFSCAIRFPGARAASFVVQSGPSQPFIVTTIKKQWPQALGIIMLAELFPAGVESVARNVVANKLQVVYLRSTNQDLVDPSRPLSPHDFNFVFGRFLPAGAASVTRSHFVSLWEWFGSLLSRIRHDALVLDMWVHGYIMGFVSKEASEALLIREPPGTFILRFSNQAPGSFAIAYTAPEGNLVHHYLISKSDVNMACSLDVFLGEKSFFSCLLQTIPSFDAELRWARVDKDKAFGKSFVAARVTGYDEALSVLRSKRAPPQ